MLTLNVGTLMEYVSGELLVGDADIVVNGLATDTRIAEPGSVFVAFVGEHVDGHDFLEQAVAAGARALIVTRDAPAISEAVEVARKRGVAVVRVTDALEAVQTLAMRHRERLFAPVVGVTGSTGKTTTKEMIKAVLGTRFKVVATEGNQNNELGVPLTMLQAGADTDVLVVEMAMRGRGQIARLCEIARPSMGLVTNVGVTHVEVVGSVEAIADAKGELVEAIPEDGTVYLNGDDAGSAGLAAKARATVVRYGTCETCQIRARDITVDEESHPTFTLLTGVGQIEVTLPIPGRHNVYNALAAAAIGLDLNLGLEDIAAGLRRMEATPMRMQLFVSASGVHVINDAYNANPTSMRAAVDTLSEYRAEGARVAVLGDMAELGSLAELAHFRLGEEVAHAGIDTLVTVGARARRIGEGAIAEGMPPDRVRMCASAEEASEVLDDLLSPGDVVLVKASRVMGLERVVDGIVEPRA